jgi:TP901 family phage tail tape measure protein
MAEGLLPPVVVHLLADIKEFQAKMGEAKGEMDTLSKKGASTGAMLSKGFGLAALGVGGLALGIAGIGIKSAMDYQAAMAKVGGQLGLTEGQTKKLADTFMRTSRGSEYSANDLANAYAGVAGQVANLSGGTDVAGSSTAILQASMELATAKGIDLNSAVSTVVGTMRTFQMPTSAAGDAMAILYNTSSATGISVDNLTSTLGRMNSAVVGVKPPASDLAGLLVDLGQHGVTGSRAISSASQAITKMLDPTFQAKAATAGLSLTTYDASGKFVGMRNVIAQLQPQLAGMTQEQQQATLKTLGLGAAGEKLLPTILAGAGAFDKATTAVTNHSKAQQASDAAGKTLKGNLEKVKSAAQDAATSLGNVLLPDATKALGWLAGPGSDHLRHFINGLEGKGHSKDPAHKLGLDIKNMVTDIGHAFSTLKGYWDKLPTPVKEMLGAGLVGAAIGSKAGPTGAGIGFLAGASTPGVVAGAQSANKGIAARASAYSQWGPFASIGEGLGVLSSWFGGGKAGAAELKPGGGGGGVGAVSGSLIAIATNTAGAATTLQTSDGRLERHGENLDKINTNTMYTSQHTREANTHLMAIAGAVKKTDKVNIKVRLV